MARRSGVSERHCRLAGGSSQHAGAGRDDVQPGGSQAGRTCVPFRTWIVETPASEKVYTHLVYQPGGGGTQGLINRTRAAGYTGPLEVLQDLTLIEIGDTISVLRCPFSSSPSISAITNGQYGSTISAGGNVIVWGNNFGSGGNQLVWTPVNGGQAVVLNESDGLYFWDQSSGQINAALHAQIKSGSYYVYVETSCVVSSATLQGSLVVSVN